MSWLRIDDGFTSNSKVVQLSDREFRVWMRTLCHCGRSQDPTVDEGTLSEVAGLTRPLVKKLADLRLLDEVGEVWEVHDWPHYQPKDATGADRQARWRARKRLSDVTNTVTAVVTDGVTEPLPRARARTRDRPDPSRTHTAKPALEEEIVEEALAVDVGSPFLFEVRSMP